MTTLEHPPPDAGPEQRRAWPPRVAAARTALGRLVTAPRTRDLVVDGAFLLALTATALGGFGSTFTESEFWWVGMLGAVLGVLTTVTVSVLLRLPGAVAVPAVLGWFFLLGPALCLRQVDLAWPGPAAWQALVDEALRGWKELLTTLPPVDGESQLLVLPWLLGLVTGWLGVVLAHLPGRRTTTSSWAAPLPVLAPVALLSTVILLGGPRPEALWAQGAAFAVLALAWLAVRHSRVGPREATVTTAQVSGRQRLGRVGAAAGLVGLAGLVALPVGIWAAGGDEGRVILRTSVERPFDVGRYPSPLASFRRFVALPRGQHSPLNLHDTTLFTIEGVPAGSRVRIAVLDRYDGVVWGAANRAQPTGSDGAGGSSDTYQRVSSVIDNPVEGAPVDARVTIGPGWSGVWLPTLGALRSIRFLSGDRGALAESFRYNLATSSAVVPAGVRPGDVYTFTARVPTDVLTPETVPSGDAGEAADAAGFLDTQAVQWSEGERQPMRRVLAIARHLKTEGRYSDGVVESERIYHAGHSRFRLTDDTGGVNSPFVVGNDEQYAALMALLANRVGVPARVVFGAVVPEGGVVTGADVHAWVELQVADGSWRTLATDQFMDVDRPAEQQTTRQQQLSGSVVPPPAPIPPPSDAGAQNDTELKVKKSRSGAKRTAEEAASEVVRWLGRAVAYVGVPLAAVTLVLSSVVVAKLLRRRRRRTRAQVSARFVGAWRELVDHARDLGQPVPVGAGVTRREQSALIVSPAARSLAHQADSHVFGPRVPRPRDAEDFWRLVDREREAMSASVGRWQRLRAALNPVTFRRA